MAPPASRVRALVDDLLLWVRRSSTPAILKAVVAHYELLFIHPFSDGNGRLARLWQHVGLLGASPLFEFVPVESLIRGRQLDYEQARRESDRAGTSTPFLEFSLGTLRDALAELLADVRPEPVTPSRQLDQARKALGARWFRRADYLRLHKAVSIATASRDLRDGLAKGLLEKRGERRLSEYRFRRE